MRSYEMKDAARLMNDLYDELTEVYKFNPTSATALTVAYFTEGNKK